MKLTINSSMQLVQSESDIQRSCITWFRMQYPKLHLRLFAIPNGGSRAIKISERGQRYSPEAQRMKAEGMLPGVPDLFLAIPKLHYGGLFIEMKSESGRLRPDQQTMIQELGTCYRVEVCRRLEEFQKTVDDYLR
jgi:hypothetical protein